MIDHQSVKGGEEEKAVNRSACVKRRETDTEKEAERGKEKIDTHTHTYKQK